MGNEYLVNFTGPFSWLGHEDTKSIFDAPEGKSSGMYLWTVKLNQGELIYYIGITNRPFSQRMKEHFKEHLAGFYHVNSPEEFKKGVRKVIWGGMYLGRRTPNILELVKTYPTISNQIVELAGVYRFFIAPMNMERRILERVEGALSKYLSNHENKSVSEFQEKDVIYRLRRQNEKPSIAKFQSNVSILGMPQVLEI